MTSHDCANDGALVPYTETERVQHDLFDDSMTHGAPDALERFFTPTPIIHALIARLQVKSLLHYKNPPMRVYEPCAGRAMSIPNALAKWGVLECFTSDLDPGAPVGFYGDAATLEHGIRPELMITNPPFSKALAILQNQMPQTSDTCVMLVRLTWFEPVKKSEDRSAFFSGETMHPDWSFTDIIITPRQKFRKTTSSHSDSATTAWVIFRRLKTRARTLAPRVEWITYEEAERWAIAESQDTLEHEFNVWKDQRIEALWKP